MARRFSQNAGIYTICLAIISMALSISATHIFVALSFLFFLYDFLSKNPRNVSVPKPQHTESSPKQTKGAFREALWQNRLLIFGGLYYFWLLVVSLLHFGGDWKLLQRAFASEISDSALYLFGLLIFAKTRKDKNSQRLIDMAFRIVAILFVLSGLVALFSEFRLGRLLSGHGFVPSAQNRPQHKLMELFGVQLYRPVGFMNTHLTFGGLLLLSLPILLSDFLRKTINTNKENTKKIKNKKTSSFNKKSALRAGTLFLLLSGFVVLLANGARSVLLGAMFFYPPLLFALFPIRLFWLWKYLLTIGSLCLLLLAIGTFYTKGFQEKNLQTKEILEETRKIQNDHPKKTALSKPGLDNPKKGMSHIFRIQNLQEKIRHTDYTRPVIWQGSWEIFWEHPIWGVGPGAFRKATWNWRNYYMQSHPRLLYFFKNTPDGHAHNDLLHIAVVSGLPGAFFFLSLIYLVGREIIRPSPKAFYKKPNHKYLQKRLCVAYGLAAFFVAGLFQCYFQDDEVVILFWALIGRYFGNFKKEKEQ